MSFLIKTIISTGSIFVILFYYSVNVFKNGPSQICGKQPLKNLKLRGLFKPYFKIFKGCLQQILFSPFLNTLSLWPC